MISTRINLKLEKIENEKNIYRLGAGSRGKTGGER